MSTSTNYSGRTVDLLIFQNTKPSGNQKIFMGFGTGGELTTGVQKVSQTFTTILLTDIGSVYDQPDYGTDLILSIQSGQTQNGSDLESAFNIAAAAAKSIMDQAAEDAGAPPDERLSTAVLSDYILDKNSGKIVLTVVITTEAGASATIYLPVSVPIT
jgi:hypothetical protein